MIFFKLFNKIGYNCFIIFQDYLNIKILKYDENFEILYIFFNFQILIFFSNFWTLNFFFKLLTPYPWNIDPSTHGISTTLPMVFWPPYPWYFDPLSMVYWPPYPWYIDPLTHGILTPLPMEYRPSYTWYFDLCAYLLIRNGGWVKIPWGCNVNRNYSAILATLQITSYIHSRNSS